MTIKQPVNYLDFNNPIHIVWRKGTPNDPFIDRLDITRVVNQRVTLLEIPDELYRVRIAGLFEINYEHFIKNSLAENEFYCDYTTGFIFFNSVKEAETISILYKGRGVILYPSNRILHYDGTDSTETLHEVIENSKLQVQELIGRTENFEEVLEGMIIATNLTKDATDLSLQATEDARNALDLINDAYSTTVLIYQPYVQKYNDIAIRYPNPQVGWTTQVFETGIRYRYNGKDWIPIDQLGGNIPDATASYSGLMSKTHFVKLEGISKETDYKTIVFICPQEILQGVQDPHIVFPHNGEIKSVSAYVSKTGTSPTPIEVQKSKDFINWFSILDKEVVIPSKKFKDDGTHSITNTTVLEGDVFRLVVPVFITDAYNLTLNIKIEIN